MKFKFLPHTADVIFEAHGKTLEEMFENSGLALEEIMVNTETVGKNEHFEIIIESKEVETLLYDFLSELLFVKDTEGLLFNKFEITIICKNKQYELLAKCTGDYIKREKQELRDDAKAITLHEFEIKQDKKKGRWIAKVLVDI